MDGAWLVHMAAHGTFRADSPLFSAIELDDGPLTVHDLERLRQAPHRVVLSSCSSAVGEAVGADELLGLVSSLISLGSAGVVASVVPVNDPTTFPLMLLMSIRAVWMTERLATATMFLIPVPEKERRMPFIDAGDTNREWKIGAAEGGPDGPGPPNPGTLPPAFHSRPRIFNRSRKSVIL